MTESNTSYFVSATKAVTKFALLMFALVCSSPLEARQDTASLSFQKIIGRESGYIHTVKQGETLWSILKNLSNKKSVSFSAIRRLNPEIKDINKIYPGQKIVIALPDNDNPPVTPPRPSRKPERGSTSCRIGPGDSITNIILFKLKIPSSEAINAYRRIKALNPKIEDLNQLPPGGSLLLPPDLLKTEEAGRSRNAGQDVAVKVEDKKEAPAKASPGLERLILSIRPVVEKMNGMINDTGDYYIPLPKKDQITVPSNLIPSVELDDGTTIFLDYDNCLKDSVKQEIRRHWPSDYFLTGPELQSVDAALRGIIRVSNHYKITHAGKPVALSSSGREITVMPDWVISGSKKRDGAPYRLAVFLLGENETPLPESARKFLEKNGLAAVYVSEGRPLSARSGKAPRVKTDWVDLRDAKGVAFAEKLLTSLGEKFQRKVPIDIFKQDVHGFNLSITADLLVRDGKRKLIVHSRKIPEQFLDILTKGDYELLFMDQGSGGIAMAEQVIRRAGLSVARGYFSGRYPREGEKRRLEISFSAVSGASPRGQFYLINWDMPDWFLPMTKSAGQAVVIRCP